MLFVRVARSNQLRCRKMQLLDMTLFQMSKMPQAKVLTMIRRKECIGKDINCEITKTTKSTKGDSTQDTTDALPPLSCHPGGEADETKAIMNQIAAMSAVRSISIRDVTGKPSGSQRYGL